MALYARLEAGVAAGGALSLFGLAAVRAGWLALAPTSAVVSAPNLLPSLTRPATAV